MNIKTINNLVAPNSDSELRMVDKKIPLEIARSWLQTRDEFRPTLGKKPEDRIQDPKGDEELVGIAVFVPALDDDTWFSPLESFVPRKTVRGGPKKPSGDNRIYRVGDVNFDNYWSALDALNQLQVPRWRHLDTIDRAREIVATGWIRKTRQELDELLNSIPQSTPDKTSRRRGS